MKAAWNLTEKTSWRVRWYKVRLKTTANVRKVHLSLRVSIASFFTASLMSRDFNDYPVRPVECSIMMCRGIRHKG